MYYNLQLTGIARKGHLAPATLSKSDWRGRFLASEEFSLFSSP